MENKDISQIALEKIKELGIKPISKKVFNLKKVLFWSLVGFSVVVGAVSFSVTLFILCNNDWYLFNQFGFGFVLKTLPYFWAIFLALLAIVGEFYYRRTLLGYRHRVVTIVGVYILLTVVLGSVIHLVGMSEKFEKALFENVPLYRGMMFDKDEFWFQPELGLLSGEIISKNGNIVQVVDKNGMIWNINLDNSFVGKRLKVEVGETIKIVGDNDGDTDASFTAEIVRPWVGGRHKDCCRVR